MVMYFELSFGVEEEFLAGLPETAQTFDYLAHILGDLSQKTLHLLTQLADPTSKLLALW